jgi:hypothetical protein
MRRIRVSRARRETDATAIEERAHHDAHGIGLIDIFAYFALTSFDCLPICLSNTNSLLMPC